MDDELFVGRMEPEAERKLKIGIPIEICEESAIILSGLISCKSKN
jgi:hypothetical protein